MKMPNKEKSLTHISLTQVLLVFVIIGILFALGIPIRKEKRLKAKSQHVEADFKLIKKALESYFERYGHYPGAPAWDTQPQNATSDDCIWQRELLNADLLRRLFPDPFSSEKGKAYYYYQYGDKKWILVSVGPDHKIARNYPEDFGEAALVIYKDKDDIIASNMDVIDPEQRFPETSG